MKTDRPFLSVSALLYAASTVSTIAWSALMPPGMSGMPMPGGWMMSMAWMRMPGQSWFKAAAIFLGMWAVMMVAMMLPSLMPVLRRYRQMVRGSHPDRSAALLGAGYFLVWSLLGLAIFPLGVALADLEMRLPALARLVPLAIPLVMLGAGALQFSSWKERQLACCGMVPAGGGGFSRGWRLGLHCVLSCAGPTAVLLVLGVMDLKAMALVTAAITLERLAPRGMSAARALG
ncbi:MAG TPA: DUF2182 domain-containing protein, partial [Magnetospirillaceae bacterium]|nr:DUF2182 domain-containing protein [Magnetospirillaceae bacterium]